MRNRVEIINNQRNVSLTRRNRVLISRTVDMVLKNEGIDFPCEISVNMINNARIKKLNEKYREIASPTDVLSFPSGEYERGMNGTAFSEDEPCYLGDIAISLEKAAEQSLTYGHSLERELAFLTAHSVLHLLGYDHVEEKDQIDMFVRQEKVLTEMGVTR